jgi:4'-phosphopantetheinyl transferase
VERLSQSLSVDETVRAARFRFGEHRDRFVVRRGLLRTILAHYVGAEPASLCFRTGPRGKPALVGECGQLRFSSSSSGDGALFAIARAREVGVDLERVHSDFCIEPLASRFLPAAEARRILALPRDIQRDQFFRQWTRMEASVKATGDGLAEVAEPRDLLRHSVRQLHPADGYVGAVAVEGVLETLQCWRWP